ncbi:MAG: hypothetical protein ACREMY_19295, partial [bacterium]
MDRPSLDQIAQTTEPQMVRRRFDEHNLVWAYVVAWFFVFASFILIPMSIATKERHFVHVVVAVCDALLTLFVVASMSELRRARRRGETTEPRRYAKIVRRNLTGWLVTLFVVKFATLIFFALNENGGWIAWGVIFPTATVALRLLLRQRIALNSMLLGIAVAAFLLAPSGRRQKNNVGILLTLAGVNIACFGGGARTSRSLKRTAIEEGVQRRTE